LNYTGKRGEEMGERGKKERGIKFLPPIQNIFLR